MLERRGIVLPFRVTPGDADVATASGPALRETRIGVILAMRASSAGQIGELAWDPARGSKLDALRNAAATVALADFAAVYTDEALLLALPQEVLLAVDVTLDESVITLATQTKLATDGSQQPRALKVQTSIRR